MGEPTVVVSAGAGEEDQAQAPVAPVFRRLDSDEAAVIVLRQVNHREFELVEGFRYHGRRGSWDVHAEDLPDTDLASIPRLLGWFASNYGRHTLAALLHDHLVRNGPRLRPPVPRHLADDVFRDALDELGVPYLRSRIMWSAVVFITRWASSAASRLALAVWLLGAAAGITALVAGIVTGTTLLLVTALVAPIPFAVLWGRREMFAGVVGGYTLWFAILPTLFNVLIYGVYMLAEVVARRLRKITRPRDVPEPSGPPWYSNR